MNLYMVHVGYYDPSVGEGIYEHHMNFFIVAENPKQAKKKVLELKEFQDKSKKPDNGMFLQAIKDLNIDVKKSYMIGDRSADYYAAKKTGIKCLIVGKKFKIKGSKNYKNLFDAIRAII